LLVPATTTTEPTETSALPATVMIDMDAMPVQAGFGVLRAHTDWEPEGVAPLQKGKALARIFFASGKTRPNKEDMTGLAKVADWLNEHGGKLLLVGHASPTGVADVTKRKIANFNVSIRRADAVKDALIKLGVSAEQIETAAQGESAPLSVEGLSPDAAGRRTDIRWIP
ncbi:MAG: OmpA family protein, partial [Pseudomonadota bacterium]|nr:OmpA family protein [Pseudomonadota bacterium]